MAALACPDAISLALTPDGTRAFIGHKDGSVREWNVPAAKNAKNAKIALPPGELGDARPSRRRALGRSHRLRAYRSRRTHGFDATGDEERGRRDSRQRRGREREGDFGGVVARARLREAQSRRAPRLAVRASGQTRLVNFSPWGTRRGSCSCTTWRRARR